MPIQQSDVTINNINLIISLVSQLKSLRTTVRELITVNTDVPLGTKINALATAALNADGTLGTADGTPTAGHVIDSRVATNSGIQRVVTNTNVTDGLQILVDLNTFLAGTATTANAARPTQIDNLSM